MTLQILTKEIEPFDLIGKFVIKPEFLSNHQRSLWDAQPPPFGALQLNYNGQQKTLFKDNFLNLPFFNSKKQIEEDIYKVSDIHLINAFDVSKTLKHFNISSNILNLIKGFENKSYDININIYEVKEVWKNNFDNAKYHVKEYAVYRFFYKDYNDYIIRSLKKVLLCL